LPYEIGANMHNLTFRTTVTANSGRHSSISFMRGHY